MGVSRTSVVQSMRMVEELFGARMASLRDSVGDCAFPGGTPRAFLFCRFAAGVLLIRLLLAIAAAAIILQVGVPATLAQATHPHPNATHGPPSEASNPQKLFAAGEAALRENKLDEAERNFRAVLAVDPGVAGAYANLGVIHMRRKQWTPALEMLHKAEKLAPTVAGIRLNIGLVYFRQSNFSAAIKPF